MLRLSVSPDTDVKAVKRFRIQKFSLTFCHNCFPRLIGDASGGVSFCIGEFTGADGGTTWAGFGDSVNSGRETLDIPSLTGFDGSKWEGG